MHNRLRMVAAGLLVAASGVVALATTSAPAQAAPIPVPGCAAGVTVTVDDAAFAGDAMVPLHDNTAGVLYPAPSDDAMSSPICGARRLADGSFRREWLYCTNADLNTCGTAPMQRKGSAATGVAALSDLDRARLAWIMGNAVDNSTATSRINSQRIVWCVTEGAASGAPAPGYFHNATDDPNLRCPNWSTIDPTLTPTPSIALTGPAGSVPLGATARFSLATNASPIAIVPTGLTGVTLCPGATGATLAGGVLTIAAPSAAAPIALCATRASGGTGTLRAAVAARTGATLEFWQRAAGTQFCQGMLSTETLSDQAVAASADASFAAEATTTTTTAAATTTTTTPTSDTSVAVTTTVPDGGATTTLNILDTSVTSPSSTLPRTGSPTQTGALLALVLLLAGVCLAAVGRSRGAGETD